MWNLKCWLNLVTFTKACTDKKRKKERVRKQAHIFFSQKQSVLLHSMCIWSKLPPDKACTDVWVPMENPETSTTGVLSMQHLIGFPLPLRPDGPRQNPDWSTNTGRRVKVWQVYRETAGWRESWADLNCTFRVGEGETGRVKGKRRWASERESVVTRMKWLAVMGVMERRERETQTQT